MCYAIIKAKFGAGEAPQVVEMETQEECAEKVAVLESNPHCVSVKVFTVSEEYARESIWVSKDPTRKVK